MKFFPACLQLNKATNFSYLKHQNKKVSIRILGEDNSNMDIRELIAGTSAKCLIEDLKKKIDLNKYDPGHVELHKRMLV